MVAFQRLIGRYGPGPAPLERDAFVASAVPEIPSSLINAACPRDGAALKPHLDEIAGFYEHTPKWGAWIDPENDDDAQALIDRGLVLDSRPVLMAAPLDTIEAPAPAHDLHVEAASMAEVGAVNDVAYGNPAGVIAAALGGFPATDVRGYGLRVEGELASVASIVDVDQDAFVTMVATLPHRRGQQLASKLLARALHEAKTTQPDFHLPPSLQARPGHLRAPRLPPARRGPPLRDASAVSLNPALEEAKYCPRCGQQATVDYPRSINCPHCGYGAYYNPKPVAAAIPVTASNEIVLLKRGFDPGKDLWTFPGGFVDLGESVEEAARREAQEELEIAIELTRLVGVYSRPEDRVVLIVFAARTTQTPQTTDEAPEVEAFMPDDIPWQELAFWSTTNALKDFLARS